LTVAGVRDCNYCGGVNRNSANKTNESEKRLGMQPSTEDKVPNFTGHTQENDLRAEKSREEEGFW